MLNKNLALCLACLLVGTFGGSGMYGESDISQILGYVASIVLAPMLCFFFLGKKTGIASLVMAAMVLVASYHFLSLS